MKKHTILWTAVAVAVAGLALGIIYMGKAIKEIGEIGPFEGCGENLDFAFGDEDA